MPQSTVRIPTPEASIGPIVDPQPISFLTTNSYEVMEQRYSISFSTDINVQKEMKKVDHWNHIVNFTNKTIICSKIIQQVHTIHIRYNFHTAGTNKIKGWKENDKEKKACLVNKNEKNG